MTTKTSKRVYHFALPYTLSGFMMYFAKGKIDESGLVPRLPKELREKVVYAEKNDSDLIITEADCNKIDDDTWEQIADLLGLNWDYLD